MPTIVNMPTIVVLGIMTGWWDLSWMEATIMIIVMTYDDVDNNAININLDSIGKYAFYIEIKSNH